MSAVEHPGFSVRAMLNEIVVDGVAIRITRKHGDMAEVLFKKFPNAASFDNLMCAYFGYEEWKDVKTIRVQLCLLRRRLKNTRLKIINENGFGYRFCLEGDKPTSDRSDTDA